MIEKILVPLDGSPLAACVFPHVITLAEATNAQVTLVSVVEKGNENSTRINPLDWQLRRVEVERYLDDVALHLSEFLDIKPETKVLEGSAAERIIEYARKQETDLIVLSTHGQGGLNAWNVNSVAQKVIQRAGKSVLLVPAYRLNQNYEANASAGIVYRHILAPLDGSQRAETVLPLVSTLAQQSESDLHLVHVIARPEMMQRIPLSNEEAVLADQLVERNQTQATHYLEQLQARLTPKTHTEVILNGHITVSLQKVAEGEEIDLVVLSAHGYSGNDRWPFGSVVTSFIAYVGVPLLIVQDMPHHAIQSSKAERVVVVEHSSWNKESAFASSAIQQKSGLWQEKLEKQSMGEITNKTNQKFGMFKNHFFNRRIELAKSW